MKSRQDEALRTFQRASIGVRGLSSIAFLSRSWMWCVVAALFLLGCGRERVTILPAGENLPQGDYHSRIKIKEVRDTFGSLYGKPVHGPSAAYNALVIDGVEFKNCLGVAPYYLDIPSQKAIVFATTTGSQPGVTDMIYVYEFITNRVTGFKASWDRGENVGIGIGKRNGSFVSLVESANDQNVILTVSIPQLSPIPERLSLDLNSKLIVQLESLSPVKQPVKKEDGK